MNIGLISTRYARSLLDYSIELGQQDDVYQKMKTIYEVFWKVPQLRVALMNRSISLEERLNIFSTASGGNLPTSLKKMADLIFLNEREDLIQYISHRFIELYRDKFKIQNGKIITAIPLSESENESLRLRFQKLVGDNLELETVVDPDIIGGFVLHINDYRWDASVSGELTRIKSHFKKIEAISASQNKQA